MKQGNSFSSSDAKTYYILNFEAKAFSQITDMKYFVSSKYSDQ